MLSSGILLSFILVLWIYFLWSRRHFYKVAWKLRGPKGLPFLGIGLNMTDPESFLSYLKEKSTIYKSPSIMWMGTKCFLYAADPETLETVFKSPHCTNKGDFYKFLSSSVGDGLVTSSSPRWNKHRKLVNPAFRRKIIINFMPVFDSAGNVLIQTLQKSATQTQDVYVILKKCVFEVSCLTTLGKKMEFQSDGFSKLFKSYKNILDIMVQRMLSPWLYPNFLYKISSLYALERKSVKVIYDFIESMIQLTPSIKENANILLKNNVNRNSFVEQVRGQFTLEDIRDEAAVLISATFETTSTAIYLVTLCLAIYPEYQQKLFEELKSIFPNKQFNVTKEDMNQMTYTEMVINEGMRLFSPIPVVIRSATDNFTLKSGIKIPKGIQIAIDIFNMQRNTQFWGPRAMDFYPDHFLSDNLISRHPFAYIPFTKGLRMCIGNRYALLLMKTLIAKIFRNFEIRTDAKLKDIIVKGTISLKLKSYPKCTIHERNS